MSGPMITGTVEQAFARLRWLEEYKGPDGIYCTPAAFKMCRKVLECWPPHEHVPFICDDPSYECLTIGDDFHSGEIRVSAVSVALVTWDWETDEHSECYTSLNKSAIASVLPKWLSAISSTETFDDYIARTEQTILT